MTFNENDLAWVLLGYLVGTVVAISLLAWGAYELISHVTLGWN